jgi:hypothetical protein
VNIELEREEDGRWIAEVPDLPGVMVYGQSRSAGLSSVNPAHHTACWLAPDSQMSPLCRSARPH